MSVLLGLAAIVTVAGALAAIAGRDARVALAGLVVALSAAPFLADPLPTPAAIATRIVAALLAGYLLFVVLRQTTVVTRGSLVGLPAETLAAAAAFVIGYGTSGLGSAALGPPEASATGFALAVIAVAPIVRGADIFRLGVALAILVTGAELVRVGLAGTPQPLEQLMTAALTVGLLGTVAVLCANVVAATGGLTMRNERRLSAMYEAHPLTPTAPSSLGRSLRPRRSAPMHPVEDPEGGGSPSSVSSARTSRPDEEAVRPDAGSAGADDVPQPTDTLSLDDPAGPTEPPAPGEPIPSTSGEPIPPADPTEPTGSAEP